MLEPIMYNALKTCVVTHIFGKKDNRCDEMNYLPSAL